MGALLSLVSHPNTVPCSVGQNVVHEQSGNKYMPLYSLKNVILLSIFVQGDTCLANRLILAAIQCISAYMLCKFSYLCGD